MASTKPVGHSCFTISLLFPLSQDVPRHFRCCYNSWRFPLAIFILRLSIHHATTRRATGRRFEIPPRGFLLTNRNEDLAVQRERIERWAHVSSIINTAAPDRASRKELISPFMGDPVFRLSLFIRDELYDSRDDVPFLLHKSNSSHAKFRANGM